MTFSNLTHRFFTLSLIILIHANAFAQNFDLPDTLFTNIERIEFEMNDSTSQICYVEYPANYIQTKDYPLFIGFAGGNQSDQFVKYCYAIYFSTSTFKNHIKVFPISTSPDGFLTEGKDVYFDLLNSFENQFNTTKDGWIVAGTSNGGVAAIEIASRFPEYFNGIITMPGTIYGEKIEITNRMNHIKVLLAYGENDSPSWIKGVSKTDSIFKSHEVLSDTLILKGQGHILDLDFNTDLIYEKFNALNGSE